MNNEEIISPAPAEEVVAPQEVVSEVVESKEEAVLKPFTNQDKNEIVAFFRDKKDVTQEQVNEYTNSRGLEAIEVGVVDDYFYQVKYDEMSALLYPKLLSALAKMKHYPEFMTDEEIKQRKAELDAIEDEMFDIFIEAEVPYRLISSTVNEIAGYTAKLFDNCKNRLSNMSATAMLSLAEKSFGNKEYTVKDAHTYINSLVNASEKK